MATINWTKKALKSLRKIDRTQQPKITTAVDGLESWPNCKNVLPLTNHSYDYRLRVGNYRVLFDVVEDVPVIVEIKEVKIRDENTY